MKVEVIYLGELRREFEMPEMTPLGGLGLYGTLEQVFALFNSARISGKEFEPAQGTRTMDVGDIIRIGDRYFRCIADSPWWIECSGSLVDELDEQAHALRRIEEVDSMEGLKEAVAPF